MGCCANFPILGREVAQIRANETEGTEFVKFNSCSGTGYTQEEESIEQLHLFLFVK